MSTQVIYITGPAFCGKTAYAMALEKFFSSKPHDRSVRRFDTELDRYHENLNDIINSGDYEMVIVDCTNGLPDPLPAPAYQIIRIEMGSAVRCGA
jgi:hypothetical protein